MPNKVLSQIKKGVGTKVDIKTRYSLLSSDRNGYLDRGREYSRFTLPYVLKSTTYGERGDAGNQHGFQGIGAQVTNHLSNKLVNTLFPVNRSFFKNTFDSKTKETLVQQGYDVTTLSEILVESEERVETFQEKVAARVAYTEALKNLIISGNVTMYLPGEGNLQAIKLDSYCVSRDLSGNLVELCIVQSKAFNLLSKEVQETIKRSKKHNTPKEEDKIKIYTWVYRISKETFAVGQSAEDVSIKEYQTISETDLPWKVIRWNSSHGEDYGRGLVEDHAGDFYVIEFLSEAIAKGMALMADVKYILKPGSVTDIDEISRSPAGEWVFGNLEDIGVLQLAKYADFTPIAEVLNEYRRRVGQAFMLNSAVRRDAERVTTVELRLDAQELETSLGGTYSSLAQTMQLPLAKLYLRRVGFPLKGIVPTILTGLSAFGKMGYLDKIQQFTEMMQLPSVWPEPLQERVKWKIYAREVAANLSMKTPFLMTDEEWAAAQAQKEQQESMAALKEGAVKAAPQIVKSQMGE